MLSRRAADEEEELSNDEDGHNHHHEKSRTHSKLISKMNEPQEAGLNLLMSGEFGRISNKAIHHRKRTNISKLVTNSPARFSPECYKADISNVCLFEV
jgi:WD repeat-containing protein 23